MCLFDWSDLRGLGHRWAEAEIPTTRRKQFFRYPAVRSRHPRYLWLQYKVSIMFMFMYRRMRSSLVRMRSSLLRMRSSLDADEI
jgi:hypothetical protein